MCRTGGPLSGDGGGSAADVGCGTACSAPGGTRRRTSLPPIRSPLPDGPGGRPVNGRGAASEPEVLHPPRAADAEVNADAEALVLAVEDVGAVSFAAHP